MGLGVERGVRALHAARRQGVKLAFAASSASLKTGGRINSYSLVFLSTAASLSHRKPILPQIQLPHSCFHPHHTSSSRLRIFEWLSCAALVLLPHDLKTWVQHLKGSIRQMDR